VISTLIKKGEGEVEDFWGEIGELGGKASPPVDEILGNKHEPKVPA